jgi:multidrug efflux pump subunit AcrA (membrane-fusion protein)
MSGLKRLVRLAVVVCLMLLLSMIVVPVAAFAQTTEPEYPTTPTTSPTTTTTVQVEGKVVNRVTDPQSLPFTGGDVALLTVLGLGAVGTGAALMLLGRRRTTSST